MKSIDVKKSRFSDASWFSKVKEFDIPIIIGGAGGIGSWLALLLSRVMLPSTSIIVYDFDSVEEVNMAGQLYSKHDIGRNKVDAIQQIVEDYAGREIFSVSEKYTKESSRSPVMFSAFDNMEARKVMFENWKEEARDYPDVSIFIDGRLLAEQLQVFFVTPDKIEQYEKHLFDDSEVESESCSYKQTSHFAAAIAAKMVQGFTNWFVKDTCELPFKYEEIGSLFLSTLNEE
jgi:molybdopterin/thiamine biosynthesis adenylyltransferase